MVSGMTEVLMNTTTWTSPDYFARIDGRATRVSVDRSKQEHGREMFVDGQCPTCGIRTDWAITKRFSDAPEYLTCLRCGVHFALEFGVPAEFMGKFCAAADARAIEAPAPKQTAAIISLNVALNRSLHVETIAKALFAATIASAMVPDQVWAQIPAHARELFFQHAEVAMLRLNSSVNAVALAHVGLEYGPAGEAAVAKYYTELVKHQPTTGVR